MDGYDDDGFLWMMMVMFLVTKDVNKVDRIIMMMDLEKGSN